MFSSIPGLEAIILTVVLVVGPWVYSEVRRIRRTSQNPPSQTPPSQVASRWQWVVFAIVAVHTVYIAYRMVLRPPPNIFSRLRVPLTTPSETLRAMLLRRAEPPTDHLPAPLEELLIRLSSFDIRTLYIRLGHDVVQSCEHCTTADEYNIVALPNALVEYICEALIAGALTSRGLQKRHWRPWAVGVLAIAAVFERYILATVHIKMPSTGMGVTMWHDNLWYCRQILFIVVPIVLYNLPSKQRRPSTLLQLDNTRGSLDRIIRNMQMLDMYRAATLRTPEFREQLANYWENEEREGEWVRNDEDVQREAAKVEMGIGPDGKLRQTVQTVAQNLVNHLSL